MTEPPDEPAKIPVGSFARSLKLGRALLGSLGRIAGGKLMGDAEASSAAAGESLALTLGQMKGLSMKIGQMLSYVDLETPEPLRLALSRLQQRSTPVSAESVARTLQEDLGQPPEAIFSWWDPKPAAAASIGQVHRARLLDGTEVAVKVRYPAIERAVRDDLKNVALLRSVFGKLAPALDTDALLSELGERFLEECDYRIEATHQNAFCAFFEGCDGVVIPRAYERYSSERAKPS